MRRLNRAMWLAVAIAAIGTVAVAERVAGAQNGPVPIGKIEGVVLNAKGQPVADASVTIQTSDGLHPHATHTDSSGRFAFDRWETGQYDLRAYGNGAFSPWSKRVMIRSRKTTTLTLRLEDDEK
jgi:hypothetical protein